MSLNDVVIIQQSGGLGRRLPPTDGVCGLIFNGVAVNGGLQLNQPYRLISVDDADALKIDKTYDTANKVLVYEQIRDFFRASQNNGELWIYGVDDTFTYEGMVEEATEKLVVGSGGAVKVVGYSYNEELIDTQEISNPVNLTAVISMAQVECDKLTTEHFPCSALVEMVGLESTDVYNYRSLNARRVTPIAAQNFSVAQNSIHQYRCAIGLALGTVALARVHENIGWVQRFNMLGGTLIKAAIGGVEMSTLTLTTQTTLHENGLVFLRVHTNIAGLYWNDSHTCTSATDDFAYLENNRVIDKATRLIRTAFLPYLNSPVYVDSQNGQLAPNVVAMLETVGSKAITDQLLTVGEISGFTFTIDPEQDILATSQLEAVLGIIPVGTARMIIVKIGFVNPFN